MSSVELTRTIRLTLACGALALIWLAVGCGNTDDVPQGYHHAGASGAAGSHSGGTAGGSSAHAGATNGHAGAGGAESGAGNQGGESGAGESLAGGGSGGITGGSGGITAGQGGAGTSGSGGAHAGASSAGTGGAGAGQGGTATAGTGGAHAGASGASAAGAGTAGALGVGGSSGASSAGAGGNLATAGTAGAGVVCGNGIKEGTEQCDDGANGVIASAKCSNTCTNISTQACVDCENAGDCTDSLDNCLGVAAPFSPAEQSMCFGVMTCIEASNCFDGTGTLVKCYCGSLNTTDCGAAPFTGAGSPDGACVAQIKAGFPTFSKNSDILAKLTASDFPSGAAMQRVTCQKTANQSACLGVCGFTTGGPVFP